jgi:hypothetical protein
MNDDYHFEEHLEKGKMYKDGLYLIELAARADESLYGKKNKAIVKRTLVAIKKMLSRMDDVICAQYPETFRNGIRVTDVYMGFSKSPLANLPSPEEARAEIRRRAGLPPVAVQRPPLKRRRRLNDMQAHEARGRIDAGTRIGVVADWYGVSVSTIRRAIARLKGE